MKTSILYELKNISFNYGEISAISDLSLNILKGERIAILGANGSGKSTLLKILDGLYFPSAGTVKFQNREINRKSFDNPEFIYSFRSQTGLVFQDPDVQLFSATVWDEVAFGPLNLGLTKNEVTQRAQWAMAKLSINHLKDRSPHFLSGGEKKRVAIASILSIMPRIWLFDEPTSGLDPCSISQFLDFIADITTEKNTIITATHDLSIVDDIADRVLVISEMHNLVADGNSEQILGNQKLLLKHNLIHVHKHKHKGKTHLHPHRHFIGHKHKKY